MTASGRRRLLWILPLAAVVGAAAVFGVRIWHSSSLASEAARLMQVLHLQPGMTAAEIGAGSGRMAILIASRLGPNGSIFATEIEHDKLDSIRQAAAQARLANVIVVKAGHSQTNLPPQCCDAIFLRKVYHHFTAPAAITASLYVSLRPGGRLAVIDFPPRSWLTWFAPVHGVPGSRGGHGMPPELLIQELTAAGFVLEYRSADWPEWNYCIVVRKPPAAASEPHPRHHPDRPGAAGL